MPPLLHIMLGVGLAPDDLQIMWVRTPATSGEFSPCMLTCSGGTLQIKGKDDGIFIFGDPS